MRKKYGIIRMSLLNLIDFKDDNSTYQKPYKLCQLEKGEVDK